LEALSRGAQQVLFVEVQPENCALIRANLRNLGFEEGARIWCADARRALKRLARSGEKFDVVFADPPYRKNWLSLLGETLKVAQVLPPGGICLVQVARRDPVIDRFGSLILEREYSYGDTKLLLYYWTDDAQGGEKEFGQQRTHGNNAVDGETGAVSQPGDENSVYRQSDSEGAAGF
jgi:16S rRNA (guanine(966)-N(2))-methyltransferase RsmD